MTKVEITTAGHSIVVEDESGTLDDVSGKALELWRSTRDPKIDRAFGLAGFATERSDPSFMPGADGALTQRGAVAL